MGIIKNYRPNGLEVTLDDDSVVKLMVIRQNQKRGIVARIRGRGPIVLWSTEDASDHVGDTDEQFISQLKVVI